MQCCLLGRTGHYVSTLALGTMTWGGRGFWHVVGQLDRDAARNQLKQAFDADVNLIDTSDVCSEGQSATYLDAAVRDLGLPRHDLIIATKARGRTGTGANRVGLSRVHLMHALDASLKRLGLDDIDLYQIHGFDEVTPIEETLRALDDMVHSGKVRSIGLSNFAAWRIMEALGISDRRNLNHLETVQAYYSLARRDIEREVLPLAAAHGLSILVWGPLAGGLLSGKFLTGADDPAGARRSSFDFPPADRVRVTAIVQVLAEIASERETSVARTALAWTMAQPGVTSVLIGAKAPDQLAANLSAADLFLTESF